MKLKSFRILNYRSINDSGEVTVGDLTSLVGRNESGKSNLLQALQTLNPVGGPKDLLPSKDFPRHRRLSECKDDTPVVETTWELDATEQAELVKAFPRAAGVTQVHIGRQYKATVRPVKLSGLNPLVFSLDEIAAKFVPIPAAAEAEINKVDPTLQPPAKQALAKLATQLATKGTAVQWAAAATPALAEFRAALTTATAKLPAQEERVLLDLEQRASQITKDGPAFTAARQWVLTRLPIFVYVDEYPELNGHQNIAEYMSRKTSNPPQQTDADLNFEKMCKVADLDPAELQRLHTQNDHEIRNQLANRAGAIVTTELRRLWKDRPLKIRFSPDANHLDTLVSDPNSVYDVEVNLDERSRGLKWFFSFYITFAADTKGGSSENAILLLDEPGLYLHALSQADLLRHFAEDFKNQILYSTHSPFMVPTENLAAVRTVNIGQETGTVVSNDPVGDSRTLFPLQAALGYSLSQSLFLGADNLVVEGVTDFWMLSVASGYLESLGKPSLPKNLTLTPAGGAQKIPYMVSLLTSERLKVLVLFDEEKKSRATRDELVKLRLIRADSIVFVSEAFDPLPLEADIEDLFEPAVYDTLVLESYSKELTGKTLNMNPHIPRIVKRYEQAFSDLGMEFRKTRPARLLLDKMATYAATMIPAPTVERFERLFAKINKLNEANTKRNSEPFS